MFATNDHSQLLFGADVVAVVLVEQRTALVVGGSLLGVLPVDDLLAVLGVHVELVAVLLSGGLLIPGVVGEVVHDDGGGDVHVEGGGAGAELGDVDEVVAHGLLPLVHAGSLGDARGREEIPRFPS